MRWIIAIIAAMLAKSLTSSGMRYRAASQNGDSAEAMKQADRLAGIIGWMTFFGVLHMQKPRNAMKQFRA